MQNLLVGMVTTVHQQAVAIVGDTFAPGEISGNDKHMSQRRFIRFGDVVNGRYDLVWNDQNEIITRLSPEKRIYFHRDPNPDRRQPHSELSIFSTVFKDIYSIFSGIDIEQEIAYIKIMINPLVWWVWLGGWVLVAGTLIALWPHKE